MGAKSEESSPKSPNPLAFALRMVLGTTAGFYYFVLPLYMWIKDKIWCVRCAQLRWAPWWAPRWGGLIA